MTAPPPILEMKNLRFVLIIGMLDGTAFLLFGTSMVRNSQNVTVGLGQFVRVRRAVTVVTVCHRTAGRLQMANG